MAYRTWQEVGEQVLGIEKVKNAEQADIGDGTSNYTPVG